MPSLLEILKDPNYVNANQATKEAIFNKYAPQDKDYSGANDATKEAIKQRFGIAGVTETEPEIPPKVDAGFSVGDTLRALGSGVVGAGKSLTDVFGADNFASEALGGVQKSIQAGYTPERAAEMARRQALEKQASESGSIVNEIGTFLGGVAEAPLQSLAQGLGSIVPYVGTGVVGAIAKLGRPALLALNTVVGTAQGAGTIKGSIYDNVKDELVKSGMDEKEAAAKAKEAQNYLGENFLDIVAGAGLGAAAARFGVESLVGKKIAGETAEEAGKKGFVRRVGEAAIAEAPMEGVQAGQEQLASNLALQRQGFDVGTFSGVAGAAARDAAIGALTAGTVGALPSRTAPVSTEARDNIKETLRADLDSRGETYTEEQLDKATDNIMAARQQQSAKEKEDESSELDTRASEQGVPGAGESGVVPGATAGAAASTAADVGGDRTTTDTTDVGERKEPSTLEEPAEIVAARSLIDAVDQGGLALNTRKVNTIARDLGLEVKKGDKPLDTIARIREALGRTDSQAAAASTAAATQDVTGFKTAKGSTYEVDAEGKTSRTKKSEGKGQGTTYAPHSALYLDTASQESMMDDMRGGMGDTAIRLGYEQDGNFVSVADINEIPEGATPKVAVVNKAENKVVSVYDAQTKPAVGLHPVEKMYTEDGMSNTHVGNKITEVTQAKAPEAVAPSVTEETDTGVLGDYFNGLLDAMNRTPVNKAIASPAVIESLKSNGLITEDGNGRLTMTPKGSNMAVELNNAVKFGAEQMTPDEQKALFAKYVPELGGVKVKEDTVAAKRTRKKKPTQLNAAPLPKTFMDWFGNSKVVDENGNPLVVYRGLVGGNVDPTKGRAGYAIFTSTNSYIASSYSGDPTGQFGVSEGVVYPMYAKADKVIEFPVNEDGTFDKFEFDKRAKTLKPGETLVARNVMDTGPRMTAAMAEGYEKKSGDVWAFATGTQFKPSIQVQNTSPKKDSLDASDQLFATAHPQVVQGIKNNDVQATLRGIRDTGGKFLSAFATRLLGLNLTTRLTFDEHYDLVLEEAEKVKEQRNRILQWLRAVYPVVYMQYFNISEMVTPYQDLAEAFTALEQGAITTADGKPLRIESIKEDIADVAKVYRNGMRTLDAPATFFINQNTATFRSEDGTSNYTVTHELAHAATHWAINNPDLLDAKQKKALDNLYDLFNYAKLHTKDPGAYGYTDLHEFVAEAFSNPAFQMELRAMKSAMDSNMSAWSKFIQTVAKLFGVDNVLFHTLANADVLFSANVDSTVSGQPSELWAPDRLNVFNGKFVLNTAERAGSKIWDTFNNLIKGRISWKDLNKKNLDSFLRSVSDERRRYLLGALTLDQLTDMVGSDIPQFKLYVAELDAMHDTRNQILSSGDKIIKEWSNLQETNPKKAEAMAQMMIFASINKLDPDSKGRGHDATKFNANPELKQKWADLIGGQDGDKALKIYRDVRKFYEDRLNEYIDIQVERIRDREKAKGTPDDAIDEIVRKKKNEIIKDSIQPYFPIKRFGEYWLQIGKGKSKIFMQFEDAAARNAELEKFKERISKKFISVYTAKGMTPEDAKKAALIDAEKELDAGQGFSESLSGKLADLAQLQRIHDLIDDTTNNITLSTDPKVQADPVNNLRKALQDQFDQLYIELQPEQSIQKMFMHRDNIAGPSQDMLRAFSVSRQRVAYQRARFQHMPQLFTIVEAARKRVSDRSIPLEERKRLKDYLHELELNLREAVLDPPKQSRITTLATNFGFLQFLSAPASAIVNAMAIPGIYAPVASAKYGGPGNVTTTLSRYARLLGGTGFVSDDTGRYEFLSLSRSNLDQKTSVGTDADSKALPQGKTLADVYQYGVARGIINVSQAHEAANIGEEPSNEYTGRWNKIMYYVSLPFHSAEKFNREMAFMSTFDMAYRKSLGKGLTPEKAYDSALQEARDVTQQTMFNYNMDNKPRYFRGDLRNIVLQFKLYPQHMTVFMFRTFQKGFTDLETAELEKIRRDNPNATADALKDMIDAKTAEIREMKKEARDAFLGMMGMTFITAGFTGMPLFFIFSGIASAFHAVFGDDDEPFDAENWFKNWTNRTFGGFLGDAISRGMLSQATGLNFADRMNTNLTDMWFPDVRKSNDEVQYLQNMFTNLLGPTAGIGINFAEGIRRFNDGHSERALEIMMPAAIKNVMVGTRYMMEGRAVTLKGNEVDADIPAASALAQMLGFSPEDTAQKQKASIEMKNVNEKIMGRRTDLLNAFFMSVDTADSAMLEKVIEKIIAFNNTNPAVGIDPNSLFKSVDKRYKDRALANITGGMSVNKNLLPQLQGMLDYSQD
jgi:hypothetical protein